MSDDPVIAAMEAAAGFKPGKPRRKPSGPAHEAVRHTPLSPAAPAPATQALVEKRGPELTAQAVDAWNKRVNGMAIVDVAHELGVSIPLAKLLITEAHAAIGEDLKANLEVNRTLDLARVDGLIRHHYPIACAGDEKSANVVLRALGHRSKLTGTEPIAQPTRTEQPVNVLLWIQQQLPQINKIVDTLPLE